MPASTTQPRYLIRWDYSRDRNFCSEPVAMGHRLGELPFFTDEALSSAIDRHPRSSLSVATMGDNPAHPNQWRCGAVGRYGGAELLQLIRRGRLHLCLAQGPVETQRVIDRLAAEMVECQPGLRILATGGQLNIASPSASQYYHYDTLPTVLWQIRGTRRVFVYPQSEPWVNEKTIEELAAGRRIDTIYYEPAFDQQACQLTIEPGQAIALPAQTPYRIENISGLSVALATRYCSPKDNRRNRIHRANRILRRLLPCRLDAQRLRGAGAACKLALASLLDLKTSASKHGRLVASGGVGSHRSTEPTFVVDAGAENCVGDQQSRDEAPKQDNVVLHTTIETPASTAAMLEN